MSQSFPTATKVAPTYQIDGKLYRRVKRTEGFDDPAAVRAKLPSGEVAYFVPVEPAEKEADA